ncbi:peptidase U34 [Algoriphagus sp. AK58]|uniref:peptidase U34 n=1 Tax=Algoriphagus sp. AK58 TaxID=1406877 RepID=UPI00164FF979|nr:peptidase U34 [Algoriphagus sp. AK58]MBC6365897.1 peptidase U34 [Algoriphagus sp. AK58]
MCDTLVALPSITSTGNLIFGKNSDREPLEAQAIGHLPRQIHQKKTLQCTYISIPQVEVTHEVILSKPFQMWGAEMGVNEYGVVIGNEAVFTNVKFDKKQVGLTGMDLLRLGLERGKTAKEALEVILILLQTYGQNACGGYQNRNFYYHNSFLIADPNEAFILETAGKSWAYKAVEDLGSISNGLTIGENYLEAHFEKEPRTIQSLFSGNPKSFRENFSDLIYTTAGRSRQRQACTLGFMQKKKNPCIEDFIQALRQHDKENFNPKKASTGCICMHATGFTNPSDTTGSMVAEIRKAGPSTVWLTGTSYPCMSLYIPFYFGQSMESELLNPGEKEDQSLWWQAKRFQKSVLNNFSLFQPKMRETWNQIQNSWIEKDKELIRKNATSSELSQFSKACLNEYWNLLKG